MSGFEPLIRMQEGVLKNYRDKTSLRVREVRFCVPRLLESKFKTILSCSEWESIGEKSLSTE